MFVGNVIELKSEALGITHAITIPVTTHAIFFAYDKGDLSLDLSHRTVETNDNKKDYS